MNTRRTAKVAAAVQQVVSSVILFELRDPRVKQVTVLTTEVAEDLRTAKVFVSVLGDDAEQRLAMHGLHSARGFIQSRIADELQLRLTPVLSFVLDQGVKRSIEVSRALRALEPEDSEVEDALEQDEEGPEEDDEGRADGSGD